MPSQIDERVQLPYLAQCAAQPVRHEPRGGRIAVGVVEQVLDCLGGAGPGKRPRWPVGAVLGMTEHVLAADHGLVLVITMHHRQPSFAAAVHNRSCDATPSQSPCPAFCLISVTTFKRAVVTRSMF